ncbi:MAG: TonB-dependent siderophore receptor [Synechococcales cyanobacterium CRU_2_2]|nr:TonB-dependent siderophore receptor [Synechococcales cyanobacterium CRU_2_2]
MEEQGVTTLTDSLRNFSGVTTGDIASGSSATSVIIRGFESNNIVRNGLRDQTLRFNAGSTNIDRIEVLKGPASVLFGVGDLGGLVNIVTKQPQSEPEYKLEFLGGAYGNYRPSLDFTGPLTADGDVNYRLNLAYQTQGSFKDFEERESYFFAPSIQVIDTDRTKLLLELEYLKETFEGLAPELPATGTVIKNPLGEVDVTKNLGEPSLARGETTQTRLGYRLSHELSSNWLLNNEFLVSFQDSPESTGITPINLTNNRLLRRFLTENPSQYTNYTFNANLIGEFPTGPIEHKLLLGFEWAQEKSDDTFSLRLLRDIDIFNPIYQPESLSARPITAFGQDATTEVSSLGLYVQDQMNLWSDRVILLLGGRFDIANQDFVDRFRAIPTAFDRQDQAFSPRVGLVLKPWENLSLYAGYNRSFKPAIGQNSQREVFIPEEGEQFEVGLKAKSPNNRLSSTLAFYNLKRSNVTTQDPDNPGFQLQVGEQQSRGFEFDLAGEIIPGWSLIGTYTYTDTEITKDNRFEVGNRLDNVPKHAASLWTTYQIQSGSLEGLGLGFGVFFEGDRAGDLNNNFDLPSYTRTDASIFYRRDRLTAQLNFKNLLNTRYFESSRDAFRVNPGPPFSIQGTLSWKF